MPKIKFIQVLKIGLILLIGVFIGCIFSFLIFPKFKNAIDLDNIYGKPLVEIDGKVWTSTSLPKDTAIEYYNLENNIFNAEKYFVSQVALRIALAKDAGKQKNTDRFPNIQELLKMYPVEDNEVKKYYDNLVQKEGVAVFSGQSYEKIKPQLKAQLTNQKSVDLASKKLHEMILSKRIKILLPPLLGPPINFDLSLFPSRGNQNAEITFINIYDYTDPNSREIENDLNEIVKKYSSKIKFISIGYPLFSTGLSAALARGSFCAKEQGDKQFWDFHNKIFLSKIPKYQGELNKTSSKKMDDKVIEFAKEVNINTVLFEACLNSNKANNYIQNVKSQLSYSNGFQGIPSFYLNRRPITYALNEIERSLQLKLK